MKIESWLFLGGIFFFIPVGIVYGVMTEWNEWVGFPALFMVAGMAGMIGFYLYYTAKRVGPRPEDRLDGEIHENAGVIGKFAPWSWWPLMLASAAAVGFLGLAIGYWILYLGVGLAVIGIIGWVYEYSRGDHAH
ncbi:putative cytochrome c oxidase polypeptide 4 [Zafaria cholistanensis]|uniref:Cytochrome c oxidase polypeptide 4 n=1 Tax=Zafaria cholistanensis TaxID=1682741 RepID=A0A5A7NQN2_9MICC|nr:cytochrome c oxidase subunit 4 [Zafaria cholistanensis]GER22128.1 putative cytochrome c oxidase polypeptide 4 [Zafaria cholistanensis]